MVEHSIADPPPHHRSHRPSIAIVQKPHQNHFPPTTISKVGKKYQNSKTLQIFFCDV